MLVTMTESHSEEFARALRNAGLGTAPLSMDETAADSSVTVGALPRKSWYAAFTKAVVGVTTGEPTAAVANDVTVIQESPELATILTEMWAPRSSAVSVYVLFMAPAMGTSSRSHW